MWEEFENMLINALVMFTESLTRTAPHKVEFFKRCRPLLYAQFAIGDTHQGFFTNVHYDYDRGWLKFRCLSRKDKPVFTQDLVNQARRE
jgi:hypothetical protein